MPSKAASPLPDSPASEPASEPPPEHRPALSVVVPVYNEVENLNALHAELSQSLVALEAEIIYVDDGSQDGSARRLQELAAAAGGRVRAILLRRNFGQTAALAAGFDAARGQVVVPIDADLQNDPADIPRLLALIEAGHDVVSGWRARRQDSFLSRTLPSRLANALISRMTGVWLHDYGCTLKAYRREVIEHLNLYGEMHRFLPALASWAGARVTEVEVNHRPRRHGQSKYGLGRTFRVVLDLVTLKFLLQYSTRPMQFFGKWGLATLCAGALMAMWAIAEKLLLGLSLNRNGWFFLAIFSLLAGLQFIALGLVGEICVRIYFESQNKRIYVVRATHPPEPPPNAHPAD